MDEGWRNYEHVFQAKDLGAFNKIGILTGHETGTLWITDFSVRKLTEAELADPEVPKLVARSAKKWARSSVSREDLLLLAEVVAENPKDSALSLRLTALPAWFGNDKELAETRRQILNLARETTDAATAERAAKACSIRATTNRAELEATLALARKG